MKAIPTGENGKNTRKSRKVLNHIQGKPIEKRGVLPIGYGIGRCTDICFVFFPFICHIGAPHFFKANLSTYREDEYKAQKWLSRSAGNGNKYADALLGKLYVESDLFGEFRNEGFDHLFNAERNGSEFAANTLGKYYMEGKVVKKDIAKAIEHLEIASAHGNMYADYRLAQIYLFEADIFDREKALEYLNRSVQAGNESAALALTRMANNQFLAVATGVLDLVGSLASIESYRQSQDCTTMPIGRKERKKHEWEQSM